MTASIMTAECAVAQSVPLCTVRNYDDLLAAMRARVVSLDTNYAAIDLVAGFTETYTTKLLAPKRIRSLSPVAFDAMLGALGLELVVRENPRAIAKVRARLAGRKMAASQLTADKFKPIVIRVSKQRMKKLAKLAAKARKKIPAWKRSAIARKAGRASAAKRRAARLGALPNYTVSASSPNAQRAAIT